ncbi:TPA: hypothetical protein RY411_004721 [Escherichia albertii]|uniref:hypothetical protein n=2 Tax=Escherichia albertii TaxID=208962 RepID=UPI001ABF7768|nr:hypothetical protein [Escherichia albertii]QST45495.1 hypothetical protein JRC45_15955 [Escherichia albertii]HEB1396320.1 hypothetical protein [Escherichia albertii]
MKMTNQKTDFFRPIEYNHDQFHVVGVYRYGRPAPSYQQGVIGKDVPVFIPHKLTDQPAEDEPQMSVKSLSRWEFWLGIFTAVIGMLSIVIGATWAISNNINDKINASRQELTGNIQSSRAEITSRIDRLEDRMESNFKETSSSLFKIQAALEAKSNKEK